MSYSDRQRWCPHGFARITSGEGQGLSACPDCSSAAPAPVYAAPLSEIDPAAANAIRCFGPGTTDGGRAEAGWFLAGQIVGDGPEIIPEHEAVNQAWDAPTDDVSR